MELNILDDGPQRRIELVGEVTIGDAAELRDALALALTTSESLELDLAEVDEIDCSALQILTALLREPHPVRLRQPSPTVLRSATLLQLEPLLAACQAAASQEEKV